MPSFWDSDSTIGIDFKIGTVSYKISNILSVCMAYDH